MAKLADLQAQAESLGIPTEKDGKNLTIAELEAAIEKVNTPEQPPQEATEKPTEAKEEEVKTSKVPRGKTFAEKVADAVPKMAAFVNGRATEKEVKAILKDLVSE